MSTTSPGRIFVPDGQVWAEVVAAVEEIQEAWESLGWVDPGSAPYA